MATDALTLELPAAAIVDAVRSSPELLRELAALVAPLLNEQQGLANEAEHARHEGEQWPDRLNVCQAAAYLACNIQRIYDLTSKGALIPLKDNNRSVYLRSELDRHLGQDEYARECRRRDRYESRLEELSRP